MKHGKVMFAFGIAVVCLFCGCKSQEEKKTGEITSAVPATPTSVVEITEPVQEELQKETVSFKEESDEAKEGDFVYFTSKITYPFYENGQHAARMNRFVESIVEEFRQSLPNAKENAALDYKDCKDSGIQGIVFPEAEEFAVSCVWANNEIEVLSSQWYSNAGGVHPNLYHQAYVVEKTTGEAMDAAKVLEPYNVSVDTFTEYAAEQIKKENGEFLYPFDTEADYKKEVRAFLDKNQWYVTENGLTVFANPYDIAPYAYGMISCEISYEVLEQGLKK